MLAEMSQRLRQCSEALEENTRQPRAEWAAAGLDNPKLCNLLHDIQMGFVTILERARKGSTEKVSELVEKAASLLGAVPSIKEEEAYRKTMRGSVDTMAKCQGELGDALEVLKSFPPDPLLAEVRSNADLQQALLNHHVCLYAALMLFRSPDFGRSSLVSWKLSGRLNEVLDALNAIVWPENGKRPSDCEELLAEMMAATQTRGQACCACFLIRLLRSGVIGVP